MNLLNGVAENDQFLLALVCVTERLFTNSTPPQLKVACLHGSTKRLDRELVLEQFPDKKVPIFIAMDIAKGLDKWHQTYFIIYEYPYLSQEYVRWSGRTARSTNTMTHTPGSSRII